MKKIAIVPGSYDPVTLGHVDIIKRAADMFEAVYAVVMINGAKTSAFTADERLQLLCSATRNIENVKCIVWNSLSADLLKETGADILVKGARNATDFDYENSMAEIMRRFAPGTETVILPAKPELFHVSSTYARERLKYNSDLSDVADPETAKLMIKLFKKTI